MKFGLVFCFRNPERWSRPFPERYVQGLDMIELAEGLGFDEIWVSEHHFVDDGYTPSLLPVAAAIAARTRRIRIGTWVLLLPLHNALRVAEDAAVVDIISSGRLDLGVGLGYRPEEFRGFGIPRSERRSRLEEGVEVIRRAWTEGRFDFQGRHYRFEDVHLNPKPVQNPHPPIWLAARGTKAAARAGRLGLSLMLNGGREAYEAYLQALTATGRDRARFSVLTRLHWLVSEDPERTWSVVSEQIEYVLDEYARWFGEAADLREDLDLMRAQPAKRRQIVMSPEECVEAIRRHAAETQTEHVVSFADLPGIDPDILARSLELFATRVAPVFRGR